METRPTLSTLSSLQSEPPDVVPTQTGSGGGIHTRHVDILGGCPATAGSTADVLRGIGNRKFGHRGLHGRNDRYRRRRWCIAIVDATGAQLTTVAATVLCGYTTITTSTVAVVVVVVVTVATTTDGYDIVVSC